jgi:hypothetical protein
MAKPLQALVVRSPFRLNCMITATKANPIHMGFFGIYNVFLCPKDKSIELLLSVTKFKL